MSKLAEDSKKLKLKPNTLYRASYIWNGEEKFGVGFAYNLEKDVEPTIGLSLPEGGVTNLFYKNILKIEEYKIYVHDFNTRRINKTRTQRVV